MSWGLWVHADNVAIEDVPALLDEVSNAGKACTTSDISVLGFMEPAHTEAMSLTAMWNACSGLRFTLVEVHISEA